MPNTVPKPEGQPPETQRSQPRVGVQCRKLGHQRIDLPFFGPKQWHADMVCPGCGLETGSSETELVLATPSPLLGES